MKSRWMMYKGNRIFYGDYTDFGFDVPALKAEMDAVITTVCAEPLHSVLAVSDVRGTKASPQTMAIFENVVKKTNPHIKRRAVIGVTAVQRSFLAFINRVTGKTAMHAFADLEQAGDWLVQEAGR